MAGAQLRRAVGEFCRMTGDRRAALSDRELLQRFVAWREEEAFEALVRRHGPMVRGTCRRVLANPADVDDAFQATFLVLAKKADALCWHDSVAPWLYKVAHRVSLKARATGIRRQHHESQAGLERATASTEPEHWRELQELLDEELHALPERYRVPLLLCYLEGLARDEAAQRLGCSTGSVKGRLERGREMLRGRLARRGLKLSTVLLGTLLAEGTASAAVPLSLTAATVQAGVEWASGHVAAGAVSAPVLTLTKGVLQAMFLTKLKLTAVVVLAAGVLGLGAGAATRGAWADEPAAKAVLAADDEDAKKADEPKRDGDQPPKKGDEGRKDGDRPREGDRPRDGDREGGAGIIVIPLTKPPEADTLAAMARVFGKAVKITYDPDLKVAILKGNAEIAGAAVQALRDSINRELVRPRDRGPREGRAAKAIDLVRLYRAEPATVEKLVKQYVSDKVQMTVKPEARAIIFEGAHDDVRQAASLARQIDGQQMHPALRRLIVPREGDRD